MALRQEPRRRIVYYRDIAPSSLGRVSQIGLTRSSRSSAAADAGAKTVMLDAWLVGLHAPPQGRERWCYFGNASARAQAAADPFEGTWAHDQFPHTTCIGVKLDMPGADTYAEVVYRLVHGFNEGLRVAGIDDRVPVPVDASVNRESASVCVENALMSLSDIAAEHDLPVPLAIDESDYMFTHCLGGHLRVRIPAARGAQLLREFLHQAQEGLHVHHQRRRHGLVPPRRQAGLFSGANQLTFVRHLAGARCSAMQRSCWGTRGTRSRRCS